MNCNNNLFLGYLNNKSVLSAAFVYLVECRFASRYSFKMISRIRIE